MVFHSSLSDNKSPQVSRTLLTILIDLSNAEWWYLFVIWFLSLPVPLPDPFGIVPSAQIAVCITVIFMIHSFFVFFCALWQGPDIYPYFHFLLILLYCLPGQKSSLFGVFFFFFFFFLTITRSGCMTEIRWSAVISKSQRSLFVSFSWTDSGLCIYHLFVWSNLNFLHNSHWIPFPDQSCLVL